MGRPLVKDNCRDAFGAVGAGEFGDLRGAEREKHGGFGWRFNSEENYAVVDGSKSWGEPMYDDMQTISIVCIALSDHLCACLVLLFFLNYFHIFWSNF